MELRRLEHFLAVVEEGTFTAAPARLFMVQSSLSASLLALERELGTDLFVRGRRGAELTDAGRALVGPARATLDQVDRAKEAVGEIRDLLVGTVRVAVARRSRRTSTSATPSGSSTSSTRASKSASCARTPEPWRTW